VSARAAFAAAAAALLNLSFVPCAAAQASDESRSNTPAEPIQVSLEGHAECRDAEFFLQQILARTPRARRASPGETGRAFVVRIVSSAPNSTGTLIIVDAAGLRSSREVTAATCDEVIAALSLVAALTIDPQAVTTPVPVPPPPPTETPAPPKPPAAPASVPPKPKSKPPAPAAPTLSPEPIAPIGPDAIAASRSSARLGAHAAAEVMSGVAPEIVLLPRALIELELELANGSWFAPSVRVSAARGEGSGEVKDVGRAEFVWTGARLELCPLRAGRGVGPYARPCLGADVAAMRASGHDLPERRSRTRPWIAPLVTLRAGWRLPFGLNAELYGGGSFPLVDDQFEFNDRRNNQGFVEVHAIPPVSFFAGLMAGFSGSIF
jgi:hypothetical protein